VVHVGHLRRLVRLKAHTTTNIKHCYRFRNKSSYLVIPPIVGAMEVGWTQRLHGWPTIRVWQSKAIILIHPGTTGRFEKRPLLFRCFSCWMRWASWAVILESDGAVCWCENKTPHSPILISLNCFS
jgi:hypothetical protein